MGKRHNAAQNRITGFDAEQALTEDRVQLTLSRNTGRVCGIQQSTVRRRLSGHRTLPPIEP
jgi:hypothetical protein